MTDSSVFPALKGRSLSGAEIRVPTDLEGELNLLFVAFRRHQQQTINRWFQAIQRIVHSGFATYEIPLMRRFPGLYREAIDSGMRSGISDADTRRRTITVYTDRARFLDDVGLPGVSRVWVALVDRLGTIHWSHVGAPTPGAVDRLNTTLGVLLRGPGRESLGSETGYSDSRGKGGL